MSSSARRERGLSIAGEPPSEIPAHNLDAERAVLGAILLEGREVLERVAQALTPMDFWKGHHRTIYHRLLVMDEAGLAPAELTLVDALREAGELEEVGGRAGVALLCDGWGAAIPAHVDDYLTFIKRDAAKRDQRAILLEATHKAANGADPVVLATETAEALLKAAERADAEAVQAHAARLPLFEPLGTVLVRTLAHIRADRPDLVPSPIAGLNQRFGGGFKKKELILLGGGPGVAKSTLMEWWARHAAQPEYGGHLTAIASIEMANEDLGQRVLADAAQVSATALRRQALEDDEWQRLERIVPTFAGLPVLLSDEVVHVKQLGRILRRRHEHGLPAIRFLIVDYLQLLEGPPGRARYEEVALIARALKRLAKKYDCTVLALSSITPDPPQKGKKARRQRPTMRNLRESRDLDHAADVILMLWQPDPEKAERELVIDKGRNGEAEGFGIRLQFIPMYQRFMEL